MLREQQLGNQDLVPRGRSGLVKAATGHFRRDGIKPETLNLRGECFFLSLRNRTYSFAVAAGLSIVEVLFVEASLS